MRAAEAYVRPTPVATHGKMKSHGFDLKNCVFTLEITASSPASEDLPSEIFLPEYHFPPGKTEIEVTAAGKWSISVDEAGGGLQQTLKWWHGSGEQTLTAKGAKRRIGTSIGKEDEEEGYLAQYIQMGKSCTVM